MLDENAIITEDCVVKIIDFLVKRRSLQTDDISHAYTVLKCGPVAGSEYNIASTKSTAHIDCS